MWINATTLAIYYYIHEVRLAFPNYSFPEFPADTDFEIVNVYPVIQTTPPEYDPITQNLVQNIQLVDEQWVQVWSLEAATPEEIAQREEVARQNNKLQAESLLQTTDWVATVDIANPQYSDPYLANQDAFLAYRSNVRKIAVNPPIVVDEWPIKPDEIWSNA